ncbi:MAG: GNAT family N-acetyltransferase [Chloroflexota bacterium]|nr:GNAT family N-acetyltransferase [Chloroflexota bacterium]
MITVRPARAHEAAPLTELALRSKAHWGYDADFLTACRPLLTVSTDSITHRWVYVVESDGQIAGFYSLQPPAETTELDMLFVEPSHIGGGHGAHLFRHACRTAYAFGVRRLTVESDPDAEPFYMRMGMSRFGERESSLRAGRMLPMLEMTLPVSTVYHLIGREVWANAQTQPEYAAPSLATEGFIHFSTEAQVAGSANKHYAGRTDLLLLEIDPVKLTAELRYESPKSKDRGDQLFPHLYGALNLNAVVGVREYAPGADGVFKGVFA